MSTSYSVAPDEVCMVVGRRLHDARRDLLDLGVRVGVLFAYNPGGPAVKHGGHPAAATIKVVPQRDRITKGYDAEMVIDQGIWDDLSPGQRVALVAHELHHIVPVIKVDKETGAEMPQLDDGGRPKLKTRPGDWNGGDGFAEIVAEFGADAIEYENIRWCKAKADAAAERGANGDAAESGTGGEVSVSFNGGDAIPLRKFTQLFKEVSERAGGG